MLKNWQVKAVSKVLGVYKSKENPQRLKVTFRHTIELDPEQLKQPMTLMSEISRTLKASFCRKWFEVGNILTSNTLAEWKGE